MTWSPSRRFCLTAAHLVQLPEITVTDAISATGIWMLHDEVRL